MSLLTRRDNVLLQQRYVNKYIALEQSSAETFSALSRPMIRIGYKSATIFGNRPFAWAVDKYNIVGRLGRIDEIVDCLPDRNKIRETVVPAKYPPDYGFRVPEP